MTISIMVRCRNSGLLYALVLALAVHGLAPLSFAQVDFGGRLTIFTIEGDGEFINIQNCCETRRLAVEVRDANAQPVPDAQVTFVLPTRGPSGYFPGNASRVFVTTDQRGQAVASGLRHNGVLGQFLIRILASCQGQRGRAVITQNNANFSVRELAEARGGQRANFQVDDDQTRRNNAFNWKKWGLLGGIAVGGVIAARILLKKDPAPPPTVTITIGPPTIGGGQ
jgi:hypothetical protein